MAGGRVFSSASGGPANVSNMTILLHNQTPRATSQPLDSLFLSTSTPFLGSRSMVSFEDVQRGKGHNGSFFRVFDLDENYDDGMDEYFHHTEKKRRLSVDQVQLLEKSFEEENKLEPERKTKIAKDLGLQPRQVAIWFQNRRARWKTKQLEKDYESLHASYENLKSNYDNLLKEKENLKAEVASLTEKVLAREKQGGNFKQQGEGETRSDILDSDSPLYNDGVHSTLLETGDSSYVFEPDQSDLSQDEEDNLSRSFLPPYIFPKLEDMDYSNPPESSCNFGFPEEDHALWSWSY
ncbi:Leucine zipper, homeobox-associated [Sesbania bispinosa]|nr:Leucine zipper, homeobox-associated [Sesbania bispinosa]